MTQESTESNWWIWKVFWLLFGITFVEVALGITKPSILWDTQLLGTKSAVIVFIVLTLIKAYYIVMEFMHLGHEKKGFKVVVVFPSIFLISYLTWLMLTEGFFKA
jgi:cytochrome c oxidase subunit IV